MAYELDTIELENRYGAHNYHPLPVVLASGEGSWVTDIHGRRYLDLLAAYSALNFGHRHPRLLQATHRQLERLTLTSRAFHNDQLGAFCAELAALCGLEAVLPMNTGAEAVETAIKLARKWGYQRKGIAAGEAKIIVFANNFHGRTTTIISFSTDPSAHDDFGPYTPGFEIVPYGDLNALTAAMDPNVVGVLVEPIQGEAGVIVPPSGWLAGVRALCLQHGVLMIVDEIQSGLGRTGRTFAYEHEGIRPDVLLLGKALGGGIVPLSAVVTDREVMDVLRPGQHGSTFGGNPLACAVGREVVAMLATGQYQQHASELGARLFTELNLLAEEGLVKQVRGRGLWAGVELPASGLSGRQVCERLLEKGVLAKETHDSTVRIAPPLTISHQELSHALGALRKVLTSVG